MISPIEKKPLFHYYPGSKWLSLGSLGCNFKCPGCQNWGIAHARPDEGERTVRSILPGEVLQLAKDNDCMGISWTYNEPTLWFEYTLHCAKCAKEGGLKTNYVTNGFITAEALDLIGPHLDSFRVDIKGFSRESYRRIAHLDRFEGILEVTVRAQRKWGMHVEVITNLIPGYNDDIQQLKNIAAWIRDHLGKSTPWHVTRFVPHLDLSHVPSTSVRRLEMAREVGLKEGLNYVYLGNVHGHPAENTYCPHCGNLLIRRDGFTVVRNDLVDCGCGHCGSPISGAFDS
jgi:pyruvate formate lyase activating enzyme